jgi:translation initiation factor 1
MSNICTTCGLPKELCVCEYIAKEDQEITVSIVRRKFGKKYTIIHGLDPKQINLKELSKSLKERLACGGCIKEGVLEFQGDHKLKVRDALIEAGFSPETIKIKDETRD